MFQAILEECREAKTLGPLLLQITLEYGIDKIAVYFLETNKQLLIVRRLFP